MSIVIRPSSLPTYADCARRVIAKMAPELIKAAGYELRPWSQTIAASVGTATHSAVAFILQSKLDTGGLGNETESEQRGLDSLKAEVERGITYDQTTPTLNVAQRQVLRQTAVYRRVVAPKVTPIAVEKRYEAQFGDFVVSGAVDLADGGVRDLKTGVRQRINVAQYGAYSLLLKAHGLGAGHIFEDYVQRVPVAKQQPDPISTPYDVATAEKISKSVIKRIARDVAEFKEKADPFVFQANPMSVLCSAKWCPVHATPFCPETQSKGKA